jgi:pimeloyl-ACP methyl ester carboxylesterase
MTNRFLPFFFACLVAGGFAGAPAQAKEPKLESTDTLIPSGDAGIQLFVRNKHLAGKPSSPDKILLFVHGATYPAETAFDLPIEGVSMMDLIAARGYDVYLVDVRGYGHSTRPVEMSQPPAANKPIVSTRVAAHDLGAAVDYILGKRKVAKINVMGWSWGTSTAASTPASTMTRSTGSCSTRRNGSAPNRRRRWPPMRRRSALIASCQKSPPGHAG